MPQKKDSLLQGGELEAARIGVTAFLAGALLIPFIFCYLGPLPPHPEIPDFAEPSAWATVVFLTTTLVKEAQAVVVATPPRTIPIAIGMQLLGLVAITYVFGLSRKWGSIVRLNRLPRLLMRSGRNTPAS
jgi:hypothetical protein